MNDPLAARRSGKHLAHRAGPRTAPGIASLASLFLAFILFLGLSGIAQAGALAPNPDFSAYDVPLYEQITRDIKEKILARLGGGKNTHDRYFIIPFAYENRGNDPAYSHSFMSVI